MYSCRGVRLEMAKRVNLSQRVITVALALAAKQNWRGIALHVIAAEAGVTIAQLHKAYPTKTAILAAFIQQIEASVLVNCAKFGPEDTARDRLFEVLMCCFDALTNHRSSVACLAVDIPRDPILALELAPAFFKSMRWTLKAASIPSTGINGCLRMNGLAVVWLATLRVWLADDSLDRARTMAALDRNLRRAEGLACRLWQPRALASSAAELT
jgi:AcrR family transcriptional regulator